MGKIKITNHLKNKGLDMTTINKGLNEISNTSYVDTLSDIIVKKSAILKEDNVFQKKSKIARYALQKGYESNLVWQQIDILVK